MLRPGRTRGRILTEHVKSGPLLAHAMAVESFMRYIARKKGQDEEPWGVIGLIRGVDYEGMKMAADRIGLRGNL